MKNRCAKNYFFLTTSVNYYKLYSQLLMREKQCSVIGPGQCPDHPKSLFLYFCLQIVFYSSGKTFHQAQKNNYNLSQAVKRTWCWGLSQPLRDSPTDTQAVMSHCTCTVFGETLPERCCCQGSSRDANQHCQDLSVRTVTLKMGGCDCSLFPKLL